MRIFVLLLTAFVLQAQSVDDAMREDFQQLMSRASLDENSRSLPSEAASKERLQGMEHALNAFIERWSSRAGELKSGRFTLGRALTFAGRPAEAVPHFRAFLKAAPNAPEAEDAELALGTALLDARAVAEAQQVLLEFATRRPNSAQLPVAQYYRGVAHWQQGEHERALELLEIAFKTAGESPIRADAGIKCLEILRDLGRVEDARTLLALLKAEHPEAPWIMAVSEQLDWIGRAAPEFAEVHAFVQGEATTLAALQGRVVVLNFFADRYDACKDELKFLESLAVKSPDVAFIGLTKHYRPYEKVDAATQDAGLREFLKAQGVKFRVLVGKGFENLKNYGVRGIPCTVIVGKDGRVAHLQVGGTRKNPRQRSDFEAALERVKSRG
jgi:TolA-binding protein/peroxiredoxin